MGAAFSSNQLAGASPSLYNLPPPALPTSYAFFSTNTLSLGFAATFSPDMGAPETANAVISPTFVLPLKGGGSTSVACGPTSVPADPTGTSISCPIANSLIGVGSGGFIFSAIGAEAVTSLSTYLVAFTTVDSQHVVTKRVTTYSTTVPSTVTVTAASTETSTTTVTVTLAGFLPPVTVTSCPTTTTSITTSSTWTAPLIPKSCRPVKGYEADHGPVRRDIAGYGPPDVTFSGADATVTITTTITFPTLTSGTTTTTSTVISTVTDTETTTADDRSPTTTTICPSTATTTTAATPS